MPMLPMMKPPPQQQAATKAAEKLHRRLARLVERRLHPLLARRQLRKHARRVLVAFPHPFMHAISCTEGLAVYSAIVGMVGLA